MKNDQIFISYVHNKSNEMSETIGWNEKETRRKMEINSQVRLRKKPHTKDHKWWEFLFKWYKVRNHKEIYDTWKKKNIYIYITASLSWRNEKKISEIKYKTHGSNSVDPKTMELGDISCFVCCKWRAVMISWSFGYQHLIEVNFPNSMKWIYPFDLNYGCWEVLLLNITTR